MKTLILLILLAITGCKKFEIEGYVFTKVTVLDGGKWPFMYNFEEGMVYTEVSYNLNQKYFNIFTYRDSVIFY